MERGNPENPVWIIGLNPKLEKEGVLENRESGHDLQKYVEEKYSYFENKTLKTIHSYFKLFQHVFGKHWLEFFKSYVLHTDLVKCPTKNFDKICIKAIKNCKPFLKKQIESYRPKIIICNGSSVSKTIRDWYGSDELETNAFETNGTLLLNGTSIHLIFCGFIGRTDNYNKHRIRKEFLKFARNTLPEKAIQLLDDPLENEIPLEDNDKMEGDLKIDEKTSRKIEKQIIVSERDLITETTSVIETTLESHEDLKHFKILSRNRHAGYRRITDEQLQKKKIWYVINVFGNASKAEIKIDTADPNNETLRKTVHELPIAPVLSFQNVKRGDATGKSHWVVRRELRGSKEDKIRRLTEIIRKDLVEYIRKTYPLLKSAIHGGNKREV